MMVSRAVSGCVVGALLALCPSTSHAQQRGTVEFGGFASLTDYAAVTNLETTWGAGARVAVFLMPRVALEFEGSGTRANRGAGRPRETVGMLAARLTAVPIRLGALSILLGAGGEYGDWQPAEDYGLQGLVGAKVDLWDGGALRVDGLRSWRSNGDGRNDALHVGLVLYRHPMGRVVTVTRLEQVSPPIVMRRDDSVSATEMRRLRAVDARHRAMLDSLAMPGRPTSSSLATMAQQVHFAKNRAELSDTARRLLDDKLAVFLANPQLRIVIVGYTSAPGTASYNMALGLRRAEAARAYLVRRGVAVQRIEIATRGEGDLLLEGPGDDANAANRRGTFRLQMADYVPPQR